MTLTQYLTALIAAFLFSITLAATDNAHAAVLGANMSLSVIAPMANNVSSAHKNLVTTGDPSVSCHVNTYEKAFLGSYKEVANHLRNMPGNATLGSKPGGGWCLRYSCTWNLGIYACNDNAADIQVPWATMAVYADYIKANCTTKRLVIGHWKEIVLGQAFDVDGWNVVLGLKAGTTC